MKRTSTHTHTHHDKKHHKRRSTQASAGTNGDDAVALKRESERERKRKSDVREVRRPVASAESAVGAVRARRMPTGNTVNGLCTRCAPVGGTHQARARVVAVGGRRARNAWGKLHKAR